ncbi:MAG TPA: hypothetical protein DCL41_04820 [Bdellovibrionales bacterium]|nr:hypothetical protein [Pseudobdellovibrionaceae bacterium]HAG91168.1 hypothetical protein [Bdellovibrionales bacterium]|tara:strand:+ start:2256 stop:2960 length:705 start_codon:yes stop_codon:yes gene_type:complete
MKSLILSLMLMTLASQSWAGSLSDDVNSLGGNKALMKKVKAIDPNNRVRVVQNRSVDRRLRLEMDFNYGAYNGGDPYLKSDSIGGQLEFHINPSISIGARYASMSNELSAEGKRVFDQASSLRAQGINTGSVEVDPAEETILGTLSYYPLYGKLNFFNRSIAQFDFYVIGGAGTTKLKSGSSPTYTAGGGLGVWMSQHISGRLEARWQGHQDQVGGTDRDINQSVLTASFGFLL